MRKPGFVTSGKIFLILGLAFLTGCDLLGLGPKKKEAAKDQTTLAAPVAAAPQAAQQEIAGPLPSNVLVRIGQWTLTTDDFSQRLNLLKQQLPDFKEDDANAKNAVLEELIRQQLMVKDAEDSGIGDSKEIKDAVEDFRKTLILQELANRLTKNVSVGESDARAYYDANKDKFVTPVTWTAREIMVGDEGTAKNILVQVLQGGDFAQIAQTQSKGANAAAGGVLKPFTLDKAPFAAMQTAIANLDAGGISGVFKGPEGYYIVKVDSKTGGEAKPFVDLKKDLSDGLKMQKQQKVIMDYLNKLAEKNKVEINKELVDQTIGKVSQ